MGLKREDREIRGLRVDVQQLPCMASFRLMPDLMKVAAPVFEQQTSLVEAVATCVANLDADRLESLTLRLLVGVDVTKDGTKIDLNSSNAINRAFNGNLAALIETLAFALEVNYQDFFGEVSEWINRGALSEESKADPETEKTTE